jgi:predicted ATPase
LGRENTSIKQSRYDPAEHRSLVTRFNSDALVASLSFRAETLWLLGYPEAALVDTSQALKQAREIGSAGTSMTALTWVAFVHIECGNYFVASAEAEELAALANAKDASLWKAAAVLLHGWLLASTGDASKAVQVITFGIISFRATGAIVWLPMFLSHLAKAYADLGQIGDAQRSTGEAMTAVETTHERWYEAEVYRVTGEIALKSPEHDLVKAEAYFERALAVARQQQAKSWELRAAMSMARLWRDQGKRDEARELLAPVYGWFTEGFDTRDLKEARALLDEFAA